MAKKDEQPDTVQSDSGYNWLCTWCACKHTWAEKELESYSLNHLELMGSVSSQEILPVGLH